MNKNIDDGYCLDSFDEGFIPQEKLEEEAEIDRLFKEARKEYRAECKARHSDYKFIKKI